MPIKSRMMQTLLKNLFSTTSASSQLYYFNNQKGIALVVTLLALVIVTALVVEFSYGVFTGTSDLYNWRDSQRLSIMANSGVNVSARFLRDWLNSQNYMLGYIEMPVENPFEDFNGVITVRIEDESSKFNINSLVQSNNKDLSIIQYESFKRLLNILSIDEKVADRIVDWIDADSIPRLTDSEVGAKNACFHSVDELLLINGIDRKDYDKLLPYITLYGNRDVPTINVNGAEKPVLMSISYPGKVEFPIDEDLAERIIKYREGMPFGSIGEFNNFAGTLLSTNSITTEGTYFSIKSTAASGGVKRIIETVVVGSSSNVEYWKEY